MRYLADGLGETAGGDLLLGVKPIYSYNTVWYVDNSFPGATDGAGWGVGPERPCKTVGYAINTLITGGVEGDIIVLGAGHDETVTAALNFTTGGNRACSIVGVGTSAGKPAAKLRWNNAAGSLFTVNRAVVHFRNIYFPEKMVDNASPTLSITQPCQIVGCWFDCGIHDIGSVITYSVSSATHVEHIVNTTFLCTAPTCVVRPLHAVTVTVRTVGEMYMDGVTFDGGTVNFSSYAYDETAFGSALKAFNVALLGGADVLLNATTTGFMHVSQSTGGARVVHG